MAPNNDYMDFRDMIQSQATKDTSNHFSISTAEKELDDYLGTEWVVIEKM